MDDSTRAALVDVSSAVIDRHVEAAGEVARQLTFTQLGVVDLIHRSRRVTVSAIADHAGVAVSTASRWVDRLQALGLASRDPAVDNRRELSVTLSSLGNTVAARWDAARVGIWSELLAELDDADVRAVIGSMHAAAGVDQTTAGGARPAAADETSASGELSQFAWQLGRALSASSPDRVPHTLVTMAAGAFDAEVALRVATHDGRNLNTVAHARPSDAPVSASDGDMTSDETVDRSLPGEAFRSGEVEVDPDGSGTLHVPITTVTQRVGVLSVTPSGAGVDAPTMRAQAIAAATIAAPHLADPKAASRLTELVSRSRSWTVGAEIQSRQLGPPRAAAYDITMAARIEPAYNSCTDSYDIELIADDHDTPFFDVAVLDSNVNRYSAPLVTGLALGAVRHARAQGRDLAEQAHLLDEAVFGHFRGEATVEFVLLRIDCVTRTCAVVATTGGIDLVHHAESVLRVSVTRCDPAGLTGEADYVASTLHFGAGERIAVLGDGFGANSATGRRAEVMMARARSSSVDEVVREMGIDLLDRTGPDGPADDATVVCIDL